MNDNIRALFVFVAEERTYVSSVDPRTASDEELEANSFVASFDTNQQTDMALPYPVYNVLVAGGAHVSFIGYEGKDW